MKRILITGISGQDGAYLAKAQLEKGKDVVGIVRNETSDLSGLNYLNIRNDVQIIQGTLEDKDNIAGIIKNHKPDAIFNLAAQSSVAESFKNPHASILFNLHSTLNILEEIRKNTNDIRFYQATSSEMFGAVASLPITEDTLLHPQSPYAISKAACHHLVRNYRESYDIHACSGILFNHESVLRRNSFFIMKLIQTALDIKYKKTSKAVFGNIKIKRDFGYAPSYVEAMIKMIEIEKADDYIICSGNSISLESIIIHVFNALSISLDCIEIDSSFFRPSEIEDIYGDNSKAKKELDWNYDLSFLKAMDIMLEEYERNIYQKK